MSASPENDMDVGIRFFEGNNGYRCFQACRSTYGSDTSKAEAILECVRMLGVKRVHTAYVGDGNGDMREARRAGVTDILIDRGEFPYRGIEPKYKIRNLPDLLELN